MLTKLKKSQREYPTTFKVLMFATFIDRLGGFLLFPFFAIYMTERFGVTEVQVGFLFMVLSAGSIIGSMIGGALADKYGRRALVLFGLIASGVGSIVMGLVNAFYIFFIVTPILGILGDIGGPARQAMVADILPKEKQTKGFGLLRVSVNISATIGPILGGVLATQSYMFLFIADATTSIATAIIVYVTIPETKPQLKEGESEESLLKTIVGYKEVLKDTVYILFLLVSSITVLVYMQLNSTLSLFLIKYRGLSKDIFGWLLSTNALMVVIFQFWITKKTSKHVPMKMMALGTLFYLVGFGMYGFVYDIYLYFIAMAILTIGEMIVIPVSTAAAANFAPEDKRARYMAAYFFHWAIPNLFGVLIAGLVMHFISPNWLWYFAGILCIFAIIGFLSLKRTTQIRFSKLEKENETLLEPLEINQ